MLFQLTYPLRGTTGARASYFDTPVFSTHVPPAGYDTACMNARRPVEDFNSRTPCGVRLELQGKYIALQEISTHVPPAGYDNSTLYGFSRFDNFNSRTPCGVRHNLPGPDSDESKFQLTYPLRGTTVPSIVFRDSTVISTHVPPAGYNCPLWFFGLPGTNFNSRTPCGVRPQDIVLFHQLSVFIVILLSEMPVSTLKKQFFNKNRGANSRRHFCVLHVRTPKRILLADLDGDTSGQVGIIHCDLIVAVAANRLSGVDLLHVDPLIQLVGGGIAVLAVVAENDQLAGGHLSPAGGLIEIKHIYDGIPQQVQVFLREAGVLLS